MTDAVTAILEGLDTPQQARFLVAVNQITGAAIQRFGVAPTVDEVVATAQAKEAAYNEDGTFDMDNALHQLNTDSLVIRAHLVAAAEADVAASAAAAGPDPSDRYAVTGVVAQIDIDEMPPHLRGAIQVGDSATDIAEKYSPNLRVAVARALSGTKVDRNPTSLTPDEIRDRADYLQGDNAARRMTEARKAAS